MKRKKSFPISLVTFENVNNLFFKKGHLEAII